MVRFSQPLLYGPVVLFLSVTDLREKRNRKREEKKKKKHEGRFELQREAYQVNKKEEKKKARKTQGHSI